MIMHSSWQVWYGKGIYHNFFSSLMGGCVSPISPPPPPPKTIKCFHISKHNDWSLLITLIAQYYETNHNMKIVLSYRKALSRGTYGHDLF